MHHHDQLLLQLQNPSPDLLNFLWLNVCPGGGNHRLLPQLGEGASLCTSWNVALLAVMIFNYSRVCFIDISVSGLVAAASVFLSLRISVVFSLGISGTLLG